MKFSYPVFQVTKNKIKTIEVHPYLPFPISAFEAETLTIISPFKVIAIEDYCRLLICVRTDVYPLMWLWWWFIYRIEKTAALFKSFVVYVAQIWGLAYIVPGKYPDWQDLGRKEPK